MTTRRENARARDGRTRTRRLVRRAAPRCLHEQSWRTSQLPKKAKDSRLEVRLAPHPEGTEITLVHTGLPKGQGKSYRKGWVDHSFDPMRD